MATLDYVVIVAYLIGTLGVGIWLSRRNRSEEEYLLGGGRMSPWSLGLSLFASLLSTITFLAVPGEVIRYGPMYMVQYLAFPFIFVVAGYFVIPRIVREPVTSAYEILETRLGVSVRNVAEALFLVSRLAWMAMILYATCAKVLVPLFGIDPAWTPLLATGLGYVTIAYTAWGGFRAVVYTDVMQATILLLGAIGCLLLAGVRTGSFAWWPTTTPDQWQEFVWINAPGGQRTFLAMLLLGFTWFVSTSGSDQVAVQRYLATRDAKSARSTLGISLLAQLCAVFLLAAIGLGLVHYYNAFPERLAQASTAEAKLSVQATPDKLFPTFIANEVPVGASGLILAALLAAAMSSLSSGVNATCAVLTVKLYPNRALRERHGSQAAKGIALGVGVVAILLSLAIPYIQGNLIEQTMKIVNLLVAPLFGLFVMALFIPRASSGATIVGCVFGVATAAMISFWQDIFQTPCPLSLFYAMPASLVVQTLVGMALSWTILPRGPGPPVEQAAA